jgi:flagellin
MQTVNDIAIRIRELVVQAANDTNVHDPNNVAQSDRARIQDEINQLLDEIDQLSARTEFNTRVLLDGTWAPPTTITNDGTDTQLVGLRDWVDAQVNLNAQQRDMLHNLITENAGGTIDLAAVNAALESVGATAVAALDDLFAGPAAVTVVALTSAMLMTAMNVAHANLSADEITALNSLVSRINEFIITPGTSGAGEVAWGSLPQFGAGLIGTAAYQFADATELNLLRNIFGDALPGTGAVTGGNLQAMFNNAVRANIETAIGYAQPPSGFFGPNAHGLIGTNGTAFLDFVNNRFGYAATDADGFLTTAAEALIGNPSVTLLPPGASFEENIEGRPLWFHIGANQNQGVTLNIRDISVAALGLNALRTFTDGNELIGGRQVAVNNPTGGVMHESGQHIGSHQAGFLNMLDDALSQVTQQRSILGAMQNRLEFTIQNLDVASENLSAANSRIRDADMAAEMMRLTQMNVLQQAATSMLAQANHKAFFNY